MSAREFQVVLLLCYCKNPAVTQFANKRSTFTHELTFRKFIVFSFSFSKVIFLNYIFKISGAASCTFISKWNYFVIVITTL